MRIVQPVTVITGAWTHPPVALCTILPQRTECDASERYEDARLIVEWLTECIPSGTMTLVRSMLNGEMTS